ncbi:hypothetical protein PANO111632_02835 [Paracoccus nototheniae]|uniref:Uncharacterized protein n=1 Tax=Paracoccus nototheniae TaxID=2489002 RepID=A0ABW4DYZ0_9RHOB|nr:hypothetical protein [Paracoccus nototheniae]
MPRPIPRFIRRLTEAPIKGKGDWIRRSRRARDLLIERHGCRPIDFYEISQDHDPSLSMSSLYPRSFARRFRGKRMDWVGRVPPGFVVHNPGCDYWGEAGDDSDPVLLLADYEFWAAFTDEDWRRMNAGDDVLAKAAKDTPE